MRVHPLLRLVRPALAPTAAADVLAAAAFAGGGGLWQLAPAVAGSLCLYSAGMAQNDLCDREGDAKLHPDRPLVAQPELVSRARWLVAGLYAAGLVLMGVAGALLPGLIIFVCANAYNLGAKRKFPWDALLLGIARSANLSVGLIVAHSALDGRGFTYLLAYFFFIGAITTASRAEDMEPPQTRRLALLLSFLPVLLALGGIWSLLTRDRALILVPLLMTGFWLVQAMGAGTREAAMRYVHRCLLSIFLLHAICLWGVGAGPALIPLCACAAVTAFLTGVLSPKTRTIPSDD